MKNEFKKKHYSYSDSKCFKIHCKIEFFLKTKLRYEKAKYCKHFKVGETWGLEIMENLITK